MTVSDQRLIRFMDRVRAKPEFVPPLTALRALGLTQADVVAMRAGTWTPPPSPLEAAVDAAVRAHLAPVRDAILQATETLQELVDAPPSAAAVPAAVQAVAAVTIAIGDALPVDNTTTPVDAAPGKSASAHAQGHQP